MLLTSCTVADGGSDNPTTNGVYSIPSDITIDAGEMEDSQDNADKPRLDVISTILPDGTNHWPTYIWPEDSPINNGFVSYTNDGAIVDHLKSRLSSFLQSDSMYGSVLIAKGGRIIYENYSSYYESQATQVQMASLTKSFVSALIGIAIDEGLIGSTQDKVMDYFTDLEIENIDDMKKSMSIEDVLTMRCGLDFSENNSVVLLYTSDNPVRELLSKKMKREPGTVFEYNTASSSILTAILHKVTGGSVFEWAKEKLFDPIGITSATWEKDKSGIEIGGTGLQMNARDLLRFGYLFLKNGVWDGEQIISEEWVRESTAKMTDIEEQSRENSGLPGVYNSYASHWWCIDEGSLLENSDGSVMEQSYSEFKQIDGEYYNIYYKAVPKGALKHGDIYRATGYAGQYIYVCPKYDMVVAMSNNNINYQEFDIGNFLMFQFILPYLDEYSDLVEVGMDEAELLDEDE